MIQQNQHIHPEAARTRLPWLTLKFEIHSPLSSQSWAARMQLLLARLQTFHTTQPIDRHRLLAHGSSRKRLAQPSPQELLLSEYSAPCFQLYLAANLMLELSRLNILTSYSPTLPPFTPPPQRPSAPHHPGPSRPAAWVGPPLPLRGSCGQRRHWCLRGAQRGGW